jgi:NADPH-dependent curcumin reductase CurA
MINTQWILMPPVALGEMMRGGCIAEVCESRHPDYSRGAAGATTSVAGQLAKLAGARVIGIAGGVEKCGWLIEELGFDRAIDYQSQDVRARLKKLCPRGIERLDSAPAALADLFTGANHGKLIVHIADPQLVAA